jgi:CRISPR-associated protein Cas6/Cse3/CasE subtype I-E
MSDPTLSRALLRLKPARGWTWEYLTHQLVADLFGDRSDRGYLYRVTRERPGGVEVLVLSADSPLPPDRLPVRDWGAAVDVQSKPFLPDLIAGQSLDFEIRLNATQVVTDEHAGRKQRTDVWEAVWRADKQTSRTPNDVYGEYLRRKLEDAAEVLTLRMTERGEVRARRGDRVDSIRFVAVNVIGTLRITDASRFLKIMSDGIGREKAFGCGLLCLSAPGTVLPRAYPEAARELY